MRVLTITLLTIINIAVQGQTIKRPVDFSPDKKFGLLITIDGPDSFPEWKYWIINEQNDTTLLSTTVTHDELPPPTFWSKTSKKIISEDQTHEKIIIYNLKDKKIEFETQGFIWGQGKNNFDQDRGLLFYFIRIENKRGTYDLMIINVETKKIKKLSSVTTSGDPLTGAPEIESIDKIKRQLTLTFETKDFKQEKLKVGY